MARKKVAVLGGGCGAITAAYELSRTPELRQKYDVTVYQLGWRLGGKGASGRDSRPGYGWRIEEHGLHVWAGFYENAFRIMRDCYRTLDRPAGTPLSVWHDPHRPEDSAFLPQNCVTVEEHLGGAWQHWVAELPDNDGLPGDGDDVLPSPWQLTKMLMEATVELIQSSVLWSGRSGGPSLIDRILNLLSDERPSPGKKLGATLAAAIKDADDDATSDDTGIGGFVGSDLHGWLIPSILSLLHHSGDDSHNHDNALSELVHHLHRWLALELRVQQGLGTALRRMWLLADLMLAHVRGILADGVITGGFEAINHLDWRDWLAQHGAEQSTIDSALVRGIYEYVFGFKDGDPTKPSLEAGTAVHGILRLALTYKGGLFWTMQAAMGEVVFTPFYEVLRQRGVKFEFFHRVKNLKLSNDKQAVARIEIGRQAHLKDPTREYQPFVHVCGIDAWPARPHYDQLVEGEQLKQGDYDLESPWSGWNDVEALTLQRGVDFDEVVLGISRGALEPICEELIGASHDWRRMIAKVETVQTQSLQLWLQPTRTELGWKAPPTILTAYESPFATWADLSFLEAREDWAPGTVGSLAYLCGVLPTMYPVGHGADFAASAHDCVMANARNWLNRYCKHIWPNAVPTDSEALNYALLVDPEGRDGAERLAAQYMRANINPSDAYVLSVPNSSAYRLAADGSGFENLYLAGDWVKTSINAGCVEAAVMAGMAAARGLTGEQRTIAGESSAA